jgi:transcriptional regulator with XRE-family HTH domain
MSGTMARDRTYSRLAIEAARLLGARVRQGRLERRWTQEEFAERVGVSPVTVRKIEAGDPSVAIGSVFEAAVLVGAPLFGDDPVRRSLESARVEDRLALLPSRARRPLEFDDDF